MNIKAAAFTVSEKSSNTGLKLGPDSRENSPGEMSGMGAVQNYSIFCHI